MGSAGLRIDYVFHRTATGVVQTDILSLEVESEGGYRPPLLHRIFGQALQPMHADGWDEWFVDDAAGEEDEAAAISRRRVDNGDVAAMRMHPNKQIELLSHLAGEWFVEVMDLFGGVQTHALAGGDVFVFVGQRLVGGVDDGGLPAALLEQVGQQPFAAGDVGDAAGGKMFGQPAVQQLEAKLFHFA